MPWSIRQAKPEDAVGLQRCMESAYSVYDERMGGILLPPVSIDYDKEIREFPTWVATSGEDIVGGITMVFDSDHASIANVAVHPEHQGQGLGKGLMQHAEEEARQLGYKELRLATHVALEENIVLYQYLGWAESGRDQTRVYMTKGID